MLRFAAAKFYKLSEELGRVVIDGAPPSALGHGIPLGEVKRLIEEMELESSLDQINRLLEAAQNGTTRLVIDGLFSDLQRRIHDDLKRKLVYCVESDRNQFCDPQWLATSVIATRFPTALKELQSAGRCYAFGEGPASAFHSMRALEVALKVLAARFGIDFENSNWQPVLEAIESKIWDIGKNQVKNQQIRDDEKFFGGLARHFIFLKNGWRNHVMHVRENYTDREARQMLDHVTDLLTDMSAQLSE